MCVRVWISDLTVCWWCTQSAMMLELLFFLQSYRGHPKLQNLFFFFCCNWEGVDHQASPSIDVVHGSLQPEGNQVALRGSFRIGQGRHYCHQMTPVHKLGGCPYVYNRCS